MSNTIKPIIRRIQEFGGSRYVAIPPGILEGTSVVEVEILKAIPGEDFAEIRLRAHKDNELIA